jgi:large subunit ribosomal protein L22
MKVLAKARNLNISAQKLRLSINGLRGSDVKVAMQSLAVQPQKGAGMVFDAIHSAVANAENNYNLKSNQLIIDEIKVDQGGKLKRWRPRSKGMTSPIMHPKAHLTVILSGKSDDKPNRGGKIMGQKINPISLRLSVTKDWSSKWFGGKDFRTDLISDIKIREPDI